MFCVSDPFIVYTSLGFFSLLLFRWESLPADVKMTQEVLSWASKNLALFCKSRYKVNEHMNCTEHFPRPPRTPHFAFEPEVTQSEITQSDVNESVASLNEPCESTRLTRELDESSSCASEKTAEQTDDSSEEEN